MISSRINRLAKEGSWVIIGQIIAILGSLVLVRVLTEYLKPVQYGQLVLGLTLGGLVNQVVMGGMSNGITRFYSIAAEKKDLYRYLRASFFLMSYATIVVVIIALVLLVSLLWLGYSQWLGLAIAALVFSVLSGYNATLNGIQNAARQRVTVALHSGLDAWLKVLLAVGMMLWLGRSSTVVLVGYALSLLLVTGSQLVFLRRLIQRKISVLQTSENWGRQIWTYSWPFSTWGVFTWAQQVSDRWALEAFTSTQEVGLYAVLFQLGYTPIGLVTGMVMTFLGPIFYQRSGAASDHTRNVSVHRVAWRITFASFLVTVFAFFFTLLLHKQIFHLLVANQYHSVSNFLPWVVLAGGIFATGQMLSLKLMSEMKSTAMITVKIVTAILGVVLNMYGASQFGLQGIIAALIAFSCIYLFWMAWLAQHPSSNIH